MTTAERLRALDESGTGGRWYGEPPRMALAGVSPKFGEGHCAYCANYGEPIWVGEQDINGTIMDSHVHQASFNYNSGDHCIYSWPRHPAPAEACVAGNYDIDSGGILDPEDTTKIVTAVNLLGAVAELVEACEQPGHFADKWGCAECGLAWPCPTERALAAVREVLGS